MVSQGRIRVSVTAQTWVCESVGEGEAAFEART